MHTPGPWGLLSSPHLDRSLLIGTPGTNVALVSCAGAAAKSEAQRDADAALICAAPDLLWALKDLLSDEKRLDDDDPILIASREQARLAIAKAEGR